MLKNLRPRVTVLMPVYNGMSYLIEAVQSILSQSLQDFRFVIVNDGSTDESMQYLESVDDPRVQVVHQPKRGLGAALNNGLSFCDTEFVARMDSDDISLPKRLETQLEFLVRHEEIGLLGTHIVYFSGKGRSGFSPPLPRDHTTIYSDLISQRHAICHPTVMCRRALLNEIGGYRTEGIGEDLDMFLRMGEISRLANLDEVLYMYRVHPDSVNAKRLAEVRRRYAYVCKSAKRRREGMSEITFDEYLNETSALPFWERMLESMTVHALSQYRQALCDILNHHTAKGYGRLTLAALCSPAWSWQRMVRIVRSLKKI